MKTLTTGLILFILWSAGSTYYYVCKIKNLCCDQTEEKTIVVKNEPPKEAPVVQPLAVPDSLILHFDYNDTSFIPEKELKAYAKRAKEYLEEHPDQKLYITGNTDATGGEAFNIRLGLERAVNAEEYFTDMGIDKDRIVIKSNSKDEPVASNKTAEGRAENRRVRIYIQ